MSNQQTDKMCELIELYALDGLSEEEAAEFREHLTTCAVCRNHLTELQLVVDLLPEASEPIEVPQGMRERVLGHILGKRIETVKPVEIVEKAKAVESVEITKPIEKDEIAKAVETLETVEKVDQRPVTAADVKTPVQAVGTAGGTSDGWRSARSGKELKPQKPQDEPSMAPRGRRASKPEKVDRKARYWQLISLGLTAAIIGLGIYTYMLKESMDGIQTELVAVNGALNATQTELGATKEKLAVATKPVDGMQVNKIIALNPAAENFISKGLASIVIDNKGTHLIVQAEDLPEVKQQEAFQVWLIKDNQPVNAGTFSPHDGKGVIYFTFEPKDYDTVAITLEPDANGVKPRGTIVLAGGLKS
jgi:hypothetical protein